MLLTSAAVKGEVVAENQPDPVEEVTMTRNGAEYTIQLNARDRKVYEAAGFVVVEAKKAPPAKNKARSTE